MIPYIGALPDLNPSTPGNNAWHIVRLQQALNLVFGEGRADMRVDGIYGPQTTDAVVAFQNFFGVPLDVSGQKGDHPGAFHRFSRWWLVHILKDIRDGK